MKVPFALRSMFTAPCEHSIIAQKAALDNGHTIVIQLPDTKLLSGGRIQGYSNCLTVTLDSADTANFEAERAPKRFPSRIKAAATALRNCSNFGRFVISHESGTVSINRA